MNEPAKALLPMVHRAWRSLPTDRTVYRDLPSHVVDWSLIEEDLSHRPSFSGYIEVVAPSASGRVFYLESQAIASHLLRGEPTGGEGFQRAITSSFVADLLRDANARLSVYALDAAVVRLAVATPNWNPQRSAPADPATMMDWLDQLELNAGTGALELTGSRGGGFVLFEYGNKVLIGFQAAAGSTAVFGVDALNMLKTAARSPDAALRLLSRDTSTAGFSASVASDQPVVGQPVVGQPAASPTQNPSFSEAPNVPPAALIAAWQGVLEFTEYRIDHVRGQGVFDAVWREICLELVDRYPQLDPFLEDIRYRKGVLSIHRPTGASFEALGVAYLRSLGKLGVQIEAVRPLLAPIRDQHLPAWQAAGLEVVCPL